MRRIGFALLVVACVCLLFSMGHAAHIGISELNPRTYMVFRDPSDGSVITTGYDMCYESEWDTAQAAAHDPTYAYLFTREGSGSATFFIHDNMPQTNCLTCYHIDGATVVACAESLRFHGKALADSSVTSWEQIKENVITRANMAAGENWAWWTEIDAKNYFVPADTVWAAYRLATHAWVEDQGYGGVGSFNIEAAEDTIWGEEGGDPTRPAAVYAGQGSSNIDIVYDDPGNEVTFNIASESVTSAEVDNYSLYATELDIATYTPEATDFGVIALEGGQLKMDWRQLDDFVDAGDDLIWGTPTGDYLYVLDYNGSGGASQAQIKEWAADIFDDGSFSGLTRTQSGSGETIQIDIDATDITGVMITNGSIMPQDLDDNDSADNGDIAIHNITTDFYWGGLKDWVEGFGAIQEDFQDVAATFILSGTKNGINIVYNDEPDDDLDWTVLIDEDNVNDNAIDLEALKATNAPVAGRIPSAANVSQGTFVWDPLKDLIEGGVGLRVSTGSTASTCSLNVDFSLVDWPASVTTIQILFADMWRAEIDTLEAGRVTADSLTMLGNRWDDGAGKLLTSVFPDSADFTSVSTVALYIDGVLAVDAFVALADSTQRDLGYATRTYVDDQIGTPSASTVKILQIGAATYDDVQDWINNTQSPGVISGGVITDNEDGTATVSVGTGFIKTTDSEIGVTRSFDWSEEAALALTDDVVNYVFIDYNDGTPVASASTTYSAIEHNRQFMLGRVYRDGTILHIIDSGLRLANYGHDSHERLIAVRGFERASGGEISETGTRSLASTAGEFYLGDNMITTDAEDTDVSGYLMAWYRDGGGGWTSATSTQISVLKYDDGDGVLGNLSNNKFGVHWVYIHYDSDLQVIYGQGNYTLAEAEIATLPSTIPDAVECFGALAAKIIVEKGVDAYVSTASAYQTLFPVSSPPEHNDLSGIQGGTASEYYHLISSEHTELNAWLDDVTLGATGALTLPAGQILTSGPASVSTSVTTPTLILRDNIATPDEVGMVLYNNQAKGLADGAMCWWDDDAVRYFVDLATLPVDDDYVVAYDADADAFYMAAETDPTVDTADKIEAILTNDAMDFGSGSVGATGFDASGADITNVNQIMPAYASVSTALSIPNGTDPDVNAAGKISNDTDGANLTGDVIVRGSDGTNQFPVGQKIVRFCAGNIIKPNDLDDATRDKCFIGANRSGMIFTITEIWAISDTDDTDFMVEEYDADGAANQSDVDAIQCTDGTGPYTDTETTIAAGVIENGHTLWIDFDDTDTPGYVGIVVSGWYNADVD